MSNCIQKIKSKIISLKDERTPIRVQILNPEQKKITKIRLDNCFVKNEKSCDWLVETEKKQLFVELKSGMKIRDVVEQISQSVSKLKKKGCEIEAICVYNYNPSNSTQIQIETARLKKSGIRFQTVKNGTSYLI